MVVEKATIRHAPIMQEPREEFVSGRQRAHVRESAAVDRQKVAAGTATEMQVLIGPDEGAPSFWMRRFIMGEGGGMPIEFLCMVPNSEDRIRVVEDPGQDSPE